MTAYSIDRALTEDTFFLNMGPQHPSTHGVLRLLLRLDGEYVVEAEPIVGYSHRGHEKMAENRSYAQFLPNTSRMDYLSGLLVNHGYCLAVEKMAGIETPPRAEYIRVITSELNRISSHLLWFGTYLLDLGGFTPFLYAFDDRENILDLLNLVSGSRLTYCYNRFGGVQRDVDDEFIAGARAFIQRLRRRLPMYDKLVTKNVIFINRTRGIGVIPADKALDFGVTGANLRACGVPYDVRKKEPYSIYADLDFEVPLGRHGDAYDRYLVRMAEMEQSLRLIEQALDRLPAGAYLNDCVPRDLCPPPGDFYFAFETARGAMGVYTVSDGGPRPYRLRWRSPCFANLSIIPVILPGTMVADTVAILGSIDVVIPEIDR